MGCNVRLVELHFVARVVEKTRAEATCVVRADERIGHGCVSVIGRGIDRYGACCTP